MIIVGNISIQDMARAINEKRHLTPEEIKTDAIIIVDKPEDPRASAEE